MKNRRGEGKGLDTVYENVKKYGLTTILAVAYLITAYNLNIERKEVTDKYIKSIEQNQNEFISVLSDIRAEEAGIKNRLDLIEKKINKEK